MSQQIQNPNENHLACDCCGETQFQLLHEWSVGDYWNPSSIPIAVWKCGKCDLVTLYPVPTAEELPGDGDWFSSGRKDRRRNRLFKTYFWEPLRKFISGSPDTRFVRPCQKVVPNGRFLDIGCGMGRNLEIASNYYEECLGIEPSDAALKAVRSKGFQVYKATIDDANLEPGSIDMALMDSVIEHVPSPTSTLAIINSFLRMGGGIGLKTPKFDGPTYRRRGRGWNGFRHGYHTYLYSGKTLSQLMEKCGFEVCQTPKRDRMFDDILILYGRKVRQCEHILEQPRPAQTRAAG